MRSRLGWGFVGAVLTLGVVPIPVVAQEGDEGSGTPTLEVLAVMFTDVAGAEKDLFAYGEIVHARLRLRNTGSEPVTGITGTMEFPRGSFLDDGSGPSGSITWPDALPGETVENEEPLRFSWGDPNDSVDPLEDHGCWMSLDGWEPAPEEVVDEAIEGEFELNDPASDPSDSARSIPPATLTFLIQTDQGGLTHDVFAGFVCAESAIRGPEDGSEPRLLATTGATQPLIALLGAGFLIVGGALRRRARLASRSA